MSFGPIPLYFHRLRNTIWLGGTMISHILVPSDASALAECVLPDVRAVASAFEARITLLHVLECSHVGSDEQAFDSLDWHLKKREAQVYIREIAARMQDTNPDVKHIILEGLPAECIIDFANNHDLDLIALSTLGKAD